jgi:hypothetical protein
MVDTKNCKGQYDLDRQFLKNTAGIDERKIVKRILGK